MKHAPFPLLLSNLSVERVVPAELETVMSQNNERGKKEDKERPTGKQIVREAGESSEARREAGGLGTGRQEDQIRLTMREKETARG